MINVINASKLPGITHDGLCVVYMYDLAMNIHISIITALTTRRDAVSRYIKICNHHRASVAATEMHDFELKYKNL